MPFVGRRVLSASPGLLLAGAISLLNMACAPPGMTSADIKKTMQKCADYGYTPLVLKNRDGVIYYIQCQPKRKNK